MSLPFDPVSSRLRVGLEIHQQLATTTKLFCSCPITKSSGLPFSFQRRLRPSQSEFGQIDPAAIFEFNKGKVNLYKWNPESSCMVETDEEPPHPLSAEALDIAILIALQLHSTVIDEVHAMRKIVIDGSNTSGFQRTMVVGIKGYLASGGIKVGVQSVTLEEDAARIIGEDDLARQFALDRLGVPLVEIALDPITAGPEEVERVALVLGRTMRSTGRVARGLGTIRQDLNMSIMDGEVVEVKGVQKLNLIAKVIRYESVRQMGLLRIAEEIRKRGVQSMKCSVKDVSSELGGAASPVLRRILSAHGKVYCMSVAGLCGLLGHEPYPGVRLGRELAEIARVNGLGGIIHSDEFEKQGITSEEERSLRAAVNADAKSALILVGGEEMKTSATVRQLVARLERSMIGPPAETRSATDDGETRYMRPRPGASRMYPETDIPEVILSEQRVQKISTQLPMPWEQKVTNLTEKYSLSQELALQLYDSEHYALFEDLASRLKLQPSVIASTVVELPPRLSREGIDEAMINNVVLADLLRAISDGRLAKEASIEVLRIVGKGEAANVEAALGKLGLEMMPENELRKVIETLAVANRRVIAEKGEASFSALMGEVMKQARGRADGQVVSRLLKEKIAEMKKAAK